MASEPEDSRVSDLREQLRSLGYLDARVDRFVLGVARDQRRPGAIASLASVRIGTLAALLMGPAAAIGIALRMPGLITGPRDGFVVALYMGALFGAGVSVAALVAILLVSWLGGRGERVRRASALVAGFVVAAVSLAYLTLWWDVSTWSARSEAHGAMWTAIALALVAAISLMVGHSVTVAALAVSVARGVSGSHRYGVPGASRRVMTAAGILTFCGAVLLFNLTSRSELEPAVPPPLTVVSSGLRVRLLAIDGFDPEVARRLAANGRLPALGAALRLVEGRGAPRRDLPVARATVQFDETRDPARVWTTIATGQSADTHAIGGLETRRVFGVQGTIAAGEPSSLGRALAAASDLVRLTRPSLASGEHRRVKSLWEIASGAGLQTAVVNWWATWPASPDSGVVVSDRAALRLERGGELDAEIAPAGLYDALRGRWPDLRKQASERASQLRGSAETQALLQRSAELDALQLSITREVAQSRNDLTCTYLAGLDVVQHALLTTGERGALSPSAVGARLGALEDYYQFLDRLLADEIVPAEGETVMIVTSPGRVQAGTAGLFAVLGTIANPLARDAVAQPTDITPTVLHALGVPISRELRGRALVELFSVEFARRYPVRDISTYGRPAATQPVRGRQPLDQEMIDRLRSLGYVR